ncbi:hypothetical protein ACVIDN_006257 [Rhizobium brockwellii]
MISARSGSASTSSRILSSNLPPETSPTFSPKNFSVRALGETAEDAFGLIGCLCLSGTS